MKQLTHAARRNPSIAQSKTSVLVLLFRALYESRHRQAERTLRRYHDVIGRAQLGIRRELIVRPRTG